MTRQAELITRYGSISSLPAGRSALVNPLVVQSGPDAGKVRFANIGVDPVSDVRYKCLYQHSEQENPEDTEITAFELEETPFPTPFASKELQDVYVIGNQTAGDSLADCDYLETPTNNALDEAIAAINVAGRPGLIVLRSGRYESGDVLNSIPAGCTLRGEGEANTFINGPGGEARSLQQADANVTFQDLTFDFSADPTGDQLITLDAPGLEFYRCTFSGGNRAAGAATKLAEILENANPKFYNCTFGNSLIAGIAAAFVAGGISLKMLECDIENIAVGISSAALNRAKIENCKFSGVTNCLNVLDMNFVEFRKNLIEFVSNGSGVVCTNSSFYCKINDNLFSIPEEGGQVDFQPIVLSTTVSSHVDFTINNNLFIGLVNSQQNYPYIQIGDASRFEIFGNQFKNVGGNLHQLDMVIDSASYFKIKKNKCEGLIQGTTIFARGEIAQNEFSNMDFVNPDGAAIDAVIGSDCQIHLNKIDLQQIGDGSAVSGIRVTTCRDSSIHHNEMLGALTNLGNGIALPTEATNVKIDKNQIYSFPNGIILTNITGGTNCDIRGNSLQGSDPSHVNGINVLSMGEAARAEISNNDMSGFAQAGIVVIQGLACLVNCHHNKSNGCVDGIILNHNALVSHSMLEGNGSVGAVNTGATISNMIALGTAAIGLNNMLGAGAGPAGIQVLGTGGQISFGLNLASGFVAPWVIAGAIASLPIDGAPAGGVLTQDING